jgi:uncharacterized membrane protein
MEIEAFATLVIPFIIVVYLGFLLFMHPPRAVLLASLLGGLTVGLINALFDVLAYYAHWWHYILNGLILHVPIPFYITPILIYGSIVYLLAWRFWYGRGHWAVVILLVCVPVFRAAIDIFAAVTHTGYVQFDSFIAEPMDVVMWLLAFYSGLLVFRRLAPLEMKLRNQGQSQ